MSENDVDERDEMVREMRYNASRLSDCLDSLLRRIEQLEHQQPGGSRAQSPTTARSATTVTMSATIAANKQEAREVRREYVSVDPLSGQRKLVTVVERLLPQNAPLRAQSPTQQLLMNGVGNGGGSALLENNSWIGGGTKRLLASAYESRIVEVQPEMLATLEVEQICGQLVAVGVSADAARLVRPGDTLLEIDGRPLTHKKQLHNLVPGKLLQLKLVLSDLYSAPMEFCKVLDDYQASQPPAEGQQQQPPYLSFSLRRGDVLQVLSRGPLYFQARKVNDLSAAGFVPCSLVRVRPVAMLSPFGRRVLVLVGANGVGRRTLKRMLIEHRQHLFAGVVPVTSRAPRPGEQEGREYQFERKEDILERIRHKQMVEWGEYQGQLYGTTADSVRRVVRSGRVCVLDCTARALESLYNAEFMPFVVAVAAPPLEELVQLSHLHGHARDEAELRRICEQSDQLLKSDCARYVDMVITNRNRDISLRRLLDALEALKGEPQWVPLEWLQGTTPPSGGSGSGAAAEKAAQKAKGG